jgi:hypothetical protein
MTAKSFVAASLLLTACAPSTGISPARTSPAITAADTKSRIYAIADDSMRGREVGRIGNFMMTSYIAREMARLGLEPGGDNGTWFQVIPVRRATAVGSTMSALGRSLTLFVDFAPVRPTPNLRVGMSLNQTGIPVVYGGRAGDSSMTLSAADAAGRIVLLDAPLSVNGTPTGVTAAPMAVALEKYPDAAGIAIAALDLVSPATMAGLRNGGAVLSNDSTARLRYPVGILFSRAAAEALMKAPLS